MGTVKSKFLPYFLAAGLAVGMSGCDRRENRTEISDTLHEDAVVVTRIYTPSRHNTEVGLRAINIDGDGAGSIGIDFSGNTGIGIGGGLQISSSTVPEKYGAVFKCKHGIFTSQGSDKRHKNLYDKLQGVQEVDVSYNEIYLSTYEDRNGDGKKELIERKLIDYDFIDAQLKKVEAEKR